VRVLVTGGAGLIGSHTVDQLLRAGRAVRVFDNLELPTHPSRRPVNVSKEAEFLLGDMRDPDMLGKALQGVNAVVHLAATGGFTARIADYMASNSLGTAHLLEIIRSTRLPLEKVVVASSIAVYGEGKYRCPRHGEVFPGLRGVAQMERREWEVQCPRCGAPLAPLPTDEDTPVEPSTPYAISKYDQERLVLTFGRQTKIPAVALRYFVTYGPRQSVHNPYTGVASIFSARILGGLPVLLYEDGNQTRDFVFVEDVARANLFALTDPRVGSGVFNVGTARATTVRALAEMLQECLQKEARIEVPGRFRPGDVRHMTADGSRLERLGFRPERSVREGLQKYVDWLQEQGPLPDSFATAEGELFDAGVIRSAE
jgi:dTDP-L-rhamnose 4-epimerase